MNWAFFDIVEEGIRRGYKSKWAVYRATEDGIKITLDDLKELGEIYKHHPKWAYYTAIEFGILGTTSKEPKKEKPTAKEQKNEYPKNYFSGIFTKAELKKAFRIWSKKLHPDMPTGNHEEFIKMKKQYDSMN